MLASPCLGQTKPKDIDGWGKIKWGMTIADARVAYDVVAEPETNEYWTFLKLVSVKISDINMDVNAVAKHGSDRIVSVKLTWVFYGHPEGPSGPRSFDTLKTLLIQKYGLPVSDEPKRESGDSVRKVLWTFPSTSILLDLGDVAVNLSYTATDKKALDVL